MKLVATIGSNASQHFKPVRLRGRAICVVKPFLSPDFRSRSVLVDEPWDYTDLFLARKKLFEAQQYWRQAREFERASKGLSVQSAPLLLYYAFMNSAKALLASKGISPDPRHGIREWTPGSGAYAGALSVGVRLKNTGVVPELARLFGETEIARDHMLKDLLYNIPFVHRTYCLTYQTAKDLFFSLVDPRFELDVSSGGIVLRAKVSSAYVTNGNMRRVPPSVTHLGGGEIVSAQALAVGNAAALTDAELNELGAFARSLREDLAYINGVETLWYLKAARGSDIVLKRQPATMTLCIMHRLSEICRYAPMEMKSMLEGQRNWLVSEFVRCSAKQFMDQIASDITCQQFMVPNFRPAS
jgi:hypothetical protein